MNYQVLSRKNSKKVKNKSFAKRYLICMILCAAVFSLSVFCPVFAASNEFTKPLTKFGDVLKVAAAAVGAVWAIVSAIFMAVATRAEDHQGYAKAVRNLLSAGILIFIDVIVSLFTS